MAKTKINRIEKIEIELLKSNPPTINFKVTGMAPTGGWSGPELLAHEYTTPPQDGIQEFEFVAEPPTNIVKQVLTLITANHVFDPRPSWVRGIRIYASSNNVETLLDELMNSKK